MLTKRISKVMFFIEWAKKFQFSISFTKSLVIKGIGNLAPLSIFIEETIRWSFE